ncbi:hypothetical protein JB92DRAFT_3135819 [Gautieria morchelliformis]|nr:hypothetical protein JB92DRAFT_3135819 [Gautieria morchelliformis]
MAAFGLDNGAEHNLTQLYPIAKPADLQQYITTVKANGETGPNSHSPGSPSGVETLQVHLRKVLHG